LVGSNAWLGAGFALALVSLGMAIIQRVHAEVDYYKLTWLGRESAEAFDIQPTKNLKAASTNKAIKWAFAGLSLAAFSLAAIAAQAPALVSVILDVGSLIVGIISLNFAVRDIGKVVFGRLTLGLALATSGWASVSLTGDLIRASKGE
jgi:hypothetical protein